MAQARAFWVRAPREGEILEEPVADADDLTNDQVLVQTLHTAVSRGTETLVFTGRVPSSEYERMRAPFMGGEFPFPVKYGYANVGRVEAGPDTLRGQIVFSLHPHQTRFVAPADAVCPVPDDVPAKRAVLAANMETALGGVWDARIAPGDRVSIVGAGVVGLLVASIVGRIPGCDVEVVDIDPGKRSIAETLGGRFRIASEAALERDVVVHASGHGDGLTTALRIAGVEARIVELSWYGDAMVSVPLGESFHARRLTIASSQVGTLPADRRARWTHRRRLHTVFDLLANPRLDGLLTSTGSLDELPATMKAFAAGGPGLCHRVDY